MSKSIIISSQSTEFIDSQIHQIIDKLKCFPSDILKIDVEPTLSSIGIKKMLELKSWTMTKPYNGKYKIAFILQAHLLTTEAQNSILKLLEEPNKGTYIVLVTQNHQLLLPTIISRCQLNIDNSKNKPSNTVNIAEFQSFSIIDKFTYLNGIEKEENKKDIIDNFLRSLLEYYRQKLLETTDREIINKILLINETKKMITAKVSSRNALENLIIQLDN